MNDAAHSPFAHLRRGLGVAALVTAVAAVLLAAWRPAALASAYRLALFLALAPAIGSLLFALVHACTGGRWGEALRPYLAAGAKLAPWLWLGIVPLLGVAPAGSWSDYDGRAMLAARAVLGGLVFLVVSRGVFPPGGRQPGPAAGPAGLIVLVFTLHFLGHDWLGRLEPGWQSTAFPLVWMLGQAVTGLGCAILAGLAGGLSPREKSGADRAAGLDWGNLLLTAALLWCYVMFAQFLIIWSANLPREVSWFVRRMQGGWGGVPVALAVFHFVLPLAILLSRRAKQSPAALGLAAGLLLAAQGIYLAWAILPAFPGATLAGVALRALLALVAAAGFGHRYLGLAARRRATP